jgi:hypothetical protein
MFDLLPCTCCCRSQRADDNNFTIHYSYDKEDDIDEDEDDDLTL